MEEKRNYIIYIAKYETERVIKMTQSQADAIQWFIDNFLPDGYVIEPAENYEGEEI